jgi:hypothetical protein
MGTKRDIRVNLGNTTCILTATNMQLPRVAVSFFNDSAQLLWVFGVEALCDM